LALFQKKAWEGNKLENREKSRNGKIPPKKILKIKNKPFYSRWLELEERVKGSGRKVVSKDTIKLKISFYRN